MAKCRINLYDICHTLELGLLNLTFFSNFEFVFEFLSENQNFSNELPRLLTTTSK